MRKTGVFILVVVILSGCMTEAYGRMGLRGTIRVPEVRYISPKDEVQIDLEGKESLVFRWLPTPIPMKGRRAYKFTIFKGFGYDVLFSEKLGPRVTEIEVPAKIFEKGQIYTWRVKQRGSGVSAWSGADIWSFKAK